MFNKKISLILLLLVFMLSISAVSAVDANSTDDVIASELDEEPPSGVSSSDPTIDVLAASNQNGYVLTGGGDIDMYERDGSRYNVTLLNGNTPVKGASVVFTVKGTDFTKSTNSLGVASLPIGLKPGSYVITARYGSLSVSNNIVISPVVKGNNTYVFYHSGSYYVAEFFNTDGSPLARSDVLFNVNGVDYARRTDANGIAKLAIGFREGRYVVNAIHPNGAKISNTLLVVNAIKSDDISVLCNSGSYFTAQFFNTNGKALARSGVVFMINGKDYARNTDANGVAKLAIGLKAGTYTITSVHPCGINVSNTLVVVNAISSQDISVLCNSGSYFTAQFFNADGSPLTGSGVVFKINGKDYARNTDANGVAKLAIGLKAGTYTITSVHPCGASVSNKVLVVNAIKSKDVEMFHNSGGYFTAEFFGSDGKPLAHTNVVFKINGKSYDRKTDANGVGKLAIGLNVGSYVITSVHPSGISVSNTLIVKNKDKTYSQYGVSEDGQTILAIGRPSASGELSQYGYYFYRTEFERTCPFCGSHELYWSIFWAGDETTNYGKFPATGNGEGSSAEGLIVCAHCDCDWSVFGHDHGGNYDLTNVTAPVKTTKADAYALKEGNYVLE